ncbi:MAG: NAD(P)H-dependent oxidoreductase subunit E [Chloroflexota bacterium]|nr:NAD(P)H-dependent oxidoreductase subunit E [Dehalococcoidia bacterium]MDW8253930.1 NAD(P)H-dependent oxidoreductase subunit E [Chloroflexota bacterium]
MSGADAAELAALLEPFEGQKGATLDALKQVQAHFGYIPNEAIDAVAKTLGVSRNTVFGVITYYEFLKREPPAQHTIRFCMGTTCDALGGRDVLREISRILGIRPFETTPDGAWHLERLPCFGTCSLAPMMQIDGEAHTFLTVEKVRQIFADHLSGEPAPIAGDGKPAPTEQLIKELGS